MGHDDGAVGARELFQGIQVLRHDHHVHGFLRKTPPPSRPVSAVLSSVVVKPPQLKAVDLVDRPKHALGWLRTAFKEGSGGFRRVLGLLGIPPGLLGCQVDCFSKLHPPKFNLQRWKIQSVALSGRISLGNEPALSKAWGCPRK